MRIQVAAAAIVACLVFTVAAHAEEPGKRRPDGDRREKLLEQFDADGDGRLNEQERKQAREKFAERFGRRPGTPGEAGRRPGPGGPGRRGPLTVDMIFERFDVNQDGQLSRDEVGKMLATMRAGREAGRRPGPGGEGRRPGPEGRRPGPGPKGPGGADKPAQ